GPSVVAEEAAGSLLRRVTGQKLEPEDVPLLDLPPVREELEDLRALLAGTPEAALDERLRRPVRGDVDESGGDLRVVAGQVDVRDHGRRAHHRVTAGGGRRQLVVGGPGLLGAGRGRAGGCAERVERRADRWIAAVRVDR